MSITQPLNDTLPCYFMDGFEALRSGIRMRIFKPPINNKIEITSKPRYFIFYKKQYTFASQNSNPNANEYWATPRAGIINDDWTLILHNKEKQELHIFFIPKGALSITQFHLKGLIKKQLRIDIDCENNPHFKNKGRVNIAFDKWYIDTIHYTL